MTRVVGMQEQMSLPVRNGCMYWDVNVAVVINACFLELRVHELWFCPSVISVAWRREMSVSCPKKRFTFVKDTSVCCLSAVPWIGHKA